MTHFTNADCFAFVVTLNFFDDILIPADCLQHPARFDETEQLWVWQYAVDDESHDLFMDIGEEIRFRVSDESFTDTSPTGPEGMGIEEKQAIEYCITFRNFPFFWLLEFLS